MSDATTWVYSRRDGTDSWVLRPDRAGDVTLDVRVVGLILESAGYVRQHDPPEAEHNAQAGPPETIAGMSIMLSPEDGQTGHVQDMSHVWQSGHHE